MAITKFKITQLPVRSTIKLREVPMVLDQEYDIDDEKNMVITVVDRGVPYDKFNFKLGNAYNNWSAEYKATINALVNTQTPSLTVQDYLVENAETIDLSADFVFNDSTDRVKVSLILPKNGQLIIDGSEAIVGKTYMLYEFINVNFISSASLISQNVQTFIMLLPMNANEQGVSANMTITSTGNLQSTIFGEVTTEGIIS